MIKTEYPIISTTNCTGSITGAQMIEGKGFIPYTDIHPEVNQNWIERSAGTGSTYRINPRKNSSSTNLYLQVVTFPLEKLALESKMSAKAYDLTGQQIGLISGAGLALGDCWDSGYGGDTTSCAADDARIGEFRYYIAP